MKKVSIVSLGCPKNLVDAERVLGYLAGDYKISFNPDNSDVVIINTCAFLEVARNESESVIKEFVLKKRKGIIEKVVVMGCYPSLNVDYLKNKFKYVDAFVGTNNLADIKKAIEKGGLFVNAEPEFIELPRLQLTLPHYSYLKIADGCNHKCAFCLIPNIKGLLHSFKMEFLIEEAKALARNGVKELILIAQDTTQYGLDFYGEIKLIPLLEALEKIDGFEWIRILYTYPQPYIFELVKFMKDSKKIVPYIDMPIQHVSDKILRLMKRGYSAHELERIVDFIKSNGFALRTSVIVGFPQEDDKDFEELLRFIEKYGIDHLGIFAYSKENGTFSYSMEDVPSKDVHNRLKELEALKEEIALKRSNSFLNKEVPFVVDFVDRNKKISTGRTIFDAPDIDNIVYVKKVLKQSNFYKGIVKQVDKYEWLIEV
ncbi:MAG: 30S ribosomal protein S12 methylthiotransferase RimO [Caldisericaceae bacterium]